MRNLKEYPVTKEEIIDLLLIYADIERIKGEGQAIGDARPLLLNEAIKHVRGSKLELSDLGTVQDSGEAVGGSGRSGLIDGGNQDSGYIPDDWKSYRR